ncbi:MAG TPA: hypothetical protein VKT82_03040 [Ktedonobacterales bacterium]|nr:hypothetical protein [Ktedonobacterales bacterium]
MLSNGRDRLQGLWVQNTRNRIVIMISTAVVAILLLCGCLNLLGVVGGGVVNSLFASGPQVRPTIQAGTQVANVNPTFPLPKPTVYNYPNPPAQNVPSSNTPPPTPTPSPTPSVTPTQPGGGPGGGRIRYQLSPDPSGRAFVAGQQNTITLMGQPGTIVSVSVFFGGSSCLPGQAQGDPVTLDNTGQGSITCTIPANLQGSMVPLILQPVGGNQQQYNVPVN